MMNDAVPVLVEEEATTPAPPVTMQELVFQCACALRTSGTPCIACVLASEREDEAPGCQVCADRGTVHVPDGDQ